MIARRWLGLVLHGLVIAGCGPEPADPPEPPDAPGADAPATAGPDTAVEAPLSLETAPLDDLFDAAREIYFAGDYDSAATYLRTVQARAQRERNAPAEARALTWMGLAAWRLGDHGQARQLGEEALAFKLQHDLQDQYFRSYNALGLLAWTENRLSDASTHYGEAIAVAQAMGDRRAAATAAGNLALVQTELAEFDDARQNFLAMRETMAELRAAATDDPDDARTAARLEANALTNLGMLEIRLGNSVAAIPLLESALDRYREIEYPTGTQSALGQLGTAYTILGEPSQAFAALDSALVVARSQGLQQEEASILEAMAELYRDAGDFSRALDLYADAKTINRELSLDIETGVDLRGEADIHIALGDLERAERFATDALEIHRSAGAPLEELRDLMMLAEILDHADRPTDADKRLSDARRLADDLGTRIGRVEVALTEARIADRRRQSRDVLAAIRRVEPDLVRGGYVAEWEAWLLTSRAHERMGHIDSAAKLGRRARETVERVRANLSSGHLRTSFVSDKREVYAHLISVLLRQGDVQGAFEVSDAARGRSLLERLSSAHGADVRAPQSTAGLAAGERLLTEIDRLVESIDYTEELAPPADRTRDQERELEAMYTRLEQARRRYETLLVTAAVSDPRRSALMGGTHTDVAAVQQALHSGQLLVEYFVPHEGEVIVFAATADDIQVLQTSITVENLASRVRLVRDLIARAGVPTPQLNAILSGLHEVLVQPVVRAGLLSGATELIVIPHHVLNYLPFAALRDPTTERFLVEEVAVRILPAAAALPLLARRESSLHGLRRVAVFAPLPTELPGSRDEARAVRAPGGVRRYIGADATEQKLWQALHETQVVHVASHGTMNAQNPLFSRVELAMPETVQPDDDGRLEVHELLDVSIQAPLVFLSGCETGLGPANSTSFLQGEDYATLAQAFLLAGARDVIATLWRVEDAGAAEFAARFFEALEERSPTQALSVAQRAMLAHERYGSPYYWAAYQLAGFDGER